MVGKELLHTLRYFVGVDLPKTQTTARERDAVARYASNALVAVEIGVFEGRTTRVIAESMQPTGTLHAIDPFLPGRLGICWSEVIARKYTSASARSQNISFLRSYSYIVAQDFQSVIDFLFVDGDHSYEGLVRDWTDWSSLISAGGFVALHDTAIPDHDRNVETYGSYKVFEEIIRRDGRFDLVETVDSLNVMRKV